jgi:sulfur carrier protein ThiS
LLFDHKLVGKKDKNHSYFSVGRGRTKKNLIMIIIPIVIAATITLLLLSTISGVPSSSNKMLLHNHATLNVTYNGQTQQVPQNIGIVSVGKAEDPLLYGDHSLDKYGMEGMSPLHTHDGSGTIHVESNTKRDFRLGEFLDIWKGLDVNDKIVQATVNGNPVSDFRNTILNDRDSISLNIS